MKPRNLEVKAPTSDQDVPVAITDTSQNLDAPLLDECVIFSNMAPLLPFRDINVHASPTHYAFSSPSTPTALTLVIDRPTGDIRLTDEKRLGSQRISSIAGILGIISLRLGS
jgi:hypothetical protein